MNRIKGALLLFLSIGLSGSSAQDTGWRNASADRLPVARSENAYVHVGDKFFLVGGRGLNPVGIYDPADKKWSAGAQPPFEMHHFQAISYHGLLYVMGAFTGPWPFETPIPSILIYDPVIDTWAIGPRIPSHRQRGAAGVAVYQDKIYLVCGIVNGHTSGWVPWLDEFDPATNLWKALPDAPRVRDHFQAAVVNGKLYAAGGRLSGKGKGFEATIGAVDVYDFASGTWATLPSPGGDIPTQRAGCSAVVYGDEIIVIGGESGSQVPAHSEAEVLNTTTGTWSSLPKLLQGRHGTQAILANQTLFVAAGCGNRGGSPELNSQETYALASSVPSFGEPVRRGKLKLSTAELDFGKPATGGQQASTLTVENIDGSQALLITYATVSGASEFSATFPYELPYVLAPGRRLDITITCQPSSSRHAEGVLQVKVLGKERPAEVLLSVN